jgi:hypothetical protein
MTLPFIGHYLPDHAGSLLKFASETAKEKKKSPTARMLGVIGAGALGTGVGSVAGYGAGELMNRLSMKVRNQPISTGSLQNIAPLVGGAAGLAYSVYKTREMEELRRALEDQNNGSG